MMYSQDILDRIRDRITLSDLVGERVNLRRQGQYHHGLCPFHQEKSPSFTVTDDKGIYYCFGCGAHGTVFTFLMKTKNMDFPEAVEEAAHRAGVALPREEKTEESEKLSEERSKVYQALALTAKYYEGILRTGKEEGQEARLYLENRGISETAQKRFGLGMSPRGGKALLTFLEKEGLSRDIMEKAGLILKRENRDEFIDRFRGRLMFPILDKRGRVIAFGARALGDEMPKYLNSPETIVFHKGSSLYGIWDVYKNRALLKDHPIVLCEGYLDVMALWEIDIPALAPLGTALTENQLQEAWRICPEPVLCFDGDLAGKRAAFRALERALPLLRPGMSLRFAELPKGEDPDTLVRKGQGSLLKSFLSKAKPLKSILWEMTSQTRTDTPETRALFKKNLLEKISKISDTDIRSAYKSEMLERYDQLFVQKRSILSQIQKEGKRTFAPRAMVSGARPMLSNASARVRQQYALILIVFLYPELIEEKIDALSVLQIQDPQLLKLREVLISYYEAGLPLERETFNTYIQNMGIKMPTSADMMAKIGWLKAPKNLADVRLQWEDIWKLSETAPSLKKDIAELKKDFEKEMTPDIWAKIQELKRLELENRNLLRNEDDV